MPLKEFVTALTVDGAPGKQERLAFNEKPNEILEKYGVLGDAIAALLSFDETTISAEVFEEAMASGWTPANAKAFTDWFSSFAGWVWPPNEENDYGGTLCQAGGATPAYSKPICEITGAEKENVSGPDGNQSYTVTLAVDGQGFVMTVRLVVLDAVTGLVLAEAKGALDPDSTFRCGRVTGTVKLKAGTYEAAVFAYVGGGESILISSGVTFVVP